MLGRVVSITIGPMTASSRPARSVLISCKPLLVFALCVTLFHFGNAAMLPLVGQKLALAHKGEETALMSACVIAAQFVMLPMALLVSVKADAWGRKPIFLAAFAILPIRGALYTLSDDRFWLVAVQLLDGVGAGIFGALTPLVLADLMRGTGRYNVSQGAVATMQGIGASLSNLVAGLIVVMAGYSAAFLALAGVSLAAFIVFLLAMPETGVPRKQDPSEAAPSDGPAQRATPCISGASLAELGPPPCGPRFLQMIISPVISAVRRDFAVTLSTDPAPLWIGRVESDEWATSSRSSHSIDHI